jgi:hypothetical protein
MITDFKGGFRSCNEITMFLVSAPQKENMKCCKYTHCFKGLIALKLL